ncbi:hypothetical protein K438DRAFT_1752576 [Mycena galopus ATCC 62051]|nr:hypothetical protein K438DRAFT_1752576 [Mycena galopus ATCC 62051]
MSAKKGILESGQLPQRRWSSAPGSPSLGNAHYCLWSLGKRVFGHEVFDVYRWSANNSLSRLPSPSSLAIQLSLALAVISGVITQDNSDCGSDDNSCQVITATEVAAGSRIEVLDDTQTLIFASTTTFLTTRTLTPPASFSTTTTTSTATSISPSLNRAEGLAVTASAASPNVTQPPSSSGSVGTSTAPVAASASSNVTQPPSSGSGGSFTVPVAASASSTATCDPTTHLGAEATPVGISQVSKPAVIGVVVGLILLALLAAVIFWLRRRRSQRNHRLSSSTLDPEASPAVEEIRTSTVNLLGFREVFESAEMQAYIGAIGTVALPSYSESIYSMEPGSDLHQEVRLTQFETQARAAQQNTEALRGSSVGNVESGPSRGRAVFPAEKNSTSSQRVQD